jgi:hypothetical protein
MRYSSVILVLVCSFAWAQTKTPAPAGKAAASAQSAAGNTGKSVATPSKETKEVAPDAAVITVKGVCAQKPAPGAECKTVITRKQFDVLADALYGMRAPNGEIPATAKRSLAQNWAKVIALSAQAEKDGLLNEPRTQALIKFGKEQAAAQEEARTIEKKATPTEAEIRKYYDDNKSTKYWEADIERIVIPAHGAGEHPPDEAAMKAMTDDIVARAKAGQSFEQLQQEVSEKAGISKQIQVKMTVRPEMLPPEVEKRMREAKLGDVNTVSQGTSGTQVYKVIKIEDIPFDKVKDTIKRQLMQERGEKQFDAVIDAHPATLNDAYFGPETQSGETGAKPLSK